MLLDVCRQPVQAVAVTDIVPPVRGESLSLELGIRLDGLLYKSPNGVNGDVGKNVDVDNSATSFLTAVE